MTTQTLAANRTEESYVCRNTSLSEVQMNEQMPRARFTPKQRLFIEAYLISKNATKAAIAAGFSERSANNQGTRLMADDDIRAEIEARLASTLDRYAVTSDRIIREMAKLAFSNVDDFISVQPDGSAIVDFATATRAELAALNAFEVHETANGRNVKFKLSDKRQALMDLAKIYRMLPADRYEHSGGPIAFDANVKEEHKIDIEAMTPEEREQLRTLLLAAVRKGPITDVEPEED
jgi:phage terminase small subunit